MFPFLLVPSLVSFDILTTLQAFLLPIHAQLTHSIKKSKIFTVQLIPLPSGGWGFFSLISPFDSGDEDIVEPSAEKRPRSVQSYNPRLSNVHQNGCWWAEPTESIPRSTKQFPQSTEMSYMVSDSYQMNSTEIFIDFWVFTFLMRSAMFHFCYFLPFFLFFFHSSTIFYYFTLFSSSNPLFFSPPLPFNSI